MLIMRTIAFGLGLSVSMMYAFFQYVVQNFIERSPVFAYSLGILIFSERIGEVSDVNSFFMIPFTLCCLGVGLFLASIIYPPFEEVLTRLLSQIRLSPAGSVNKSMEAQR